MALPFIAVGAVGLLAFTAYRAYRKEADRLEREDRERSLKDPGPALERDPETGRYRLPRSER